LKWAKKRGFSPPKSGAADNEIVESARHQSTLSQSTIAAMIAEYKRLFLDRSNYWDGSPSLDIDWLRNALYAMEFEKSFLDRCERTYHWQFPSLLPALHDGSFYPADPAIPSQRIRESGRSMLLGFATALCGIMIQHPELESNGYHHFQKSLLQDGFQWVGTRLVETNQDIIPEAEEISAVESLIRNSIHDHQEIVLHHFVNGRSLYTSGPYHACRSEWRSFLEEVLRGVWRITRSHRPEFSTFSEKPSTKDLFDFLQRSGFLNADEKLAVTSTWGFLCAGGHPGISDQDDAHLSMILALTFGHAALLKLEKWAANSFLRF
jgi:hypothetical protein